MPSDCSLVAVTLVYSLLGIRSFLALPSDCSLVAMTLVYSLSGAARRVLDRRKARRSLGGQIDLKANTIKIVGIDSTGALDSEGITINSEAAFVLDNSIISSETFGDGKGGDIRINAPSIELTNGAKLVTSTSSGGNAVKKAEVRRQRAAMYPYA